MLDKTILKCLEFAEGTGKQFARVKCDYFPVSLISDKKQIEIARLRESGLALREIAEKMGFSTVKTVVEHLQKYEEKKKFYEEWNAFLQSSGEVRQIAFSEIAEGVLTDRQLKAYNSKNIWTVGDYLDLSVKMSVREMQIFIGDTNSDYKKRRSQLFQNMKKLFQNNNQKE